MCIGAKKGVDHGDTFFVQCRNERDVRFFNWYIPQPSGLPISFLITLVDPNHTVFHYVSFGYQKMDYIDSITEAHPIY